ncbi:ParB/RepB/Spo0J family partition protein [candidate division KSB1 bacterium]|nr:ParB/RepB/Spo0J family partition protein [candidate division KSB1 bacterium]
MVNKKALGRGLGALLPDDSDQKQTAGRIEFVKVSTISPNPFQPRENFDPETLQELKNSIRENGVVQPVTVRMFGDGYQLIAGERRLRAVRDLGLPEIPAYILDVSSDEEMLELAIVENIHREDLNPIDIAQGYRRLIDECKLTQEQVAEKVGKDRTTVTNFLRLLKLPRRVQTSMSNKDLSMGHARALLALPSAEKQIEALQQITKKRLSVRQVEQLVRKMTEPKTPGKAKNETVNYYVEDVENKLRQRLATKVAIKPRSKGGTVEIAYFSDDDLERLVSLMCNNSE